MKLLIFLCLAGSVVCVAANDQDSPLLNGKIVGGGSSGNTTTRFPYHVSIQYMGSHICSGSIISNNYVLSAASCAIYGSNIVIRAGSMYSNTGGNIYSVASAIRHSSYSSATQDYNYGLFRIQGEFKLGTTEKIIDLPELGESPPNGSSGAVTGWVYTKIVGGSSTALKAVNVTIARKEECSQCGYFPTNICAHKDNENDECMSDYGSPLAVGNKLFGMVNSLYACRRPTCPETYANIAAIRSWIRSNTGI